ncbi:Mediator of RNA polymerase II transcription subunit 6 [Saitoella coloradoensis]
MGTPEFTNMLKQLRGLEYVLAYHNMPDVFVVRAQERHSPNHVTPLHLYFCANGNIYLAPSLHSILTSRTLNALHSVKEALTLTTSLANFDPAAAGGGAGYTYAFTAKEEGGEEEKVKEEERREREMLGIALRAAEGSVGEKKKEVVVQVPVVKVEEVRGEGVNRKKVRIA